MFGNNNNNKSSAEEFLGYMVAMVVFMGTIFVVTYKGVVKVANWGLSRHQDKKERERINKL